MKKGSTTRSIQPRADCARGRQPGIHLNARRADAAAQAKLPTRSHPGHRTLVTWKFSQIGSNIPLGFKFWTYFFLKGTFISGVGQIKTDSSG